MIRAVSKSADDTRELAAQLAGIVMDRDIILLSGELGAGKTTFAQGFGRSLGAIGPITSPTFTLMRSYPGRLTLHHVDVCRLGTLQEMADLDLIELLEEGGVALVEWGELASPVLPADYLHVQIESVDDDDDDDARRFGFEFIGPEWAARTRKLSLALARWITQDEEQRP